MSRLKIAIVGTRGIPANYGGFETFAEEMATRLVRRGHDVRVYCRSHYSTLRDPEYRGVKRIVLPALRHKYFDTLSHTFLSTLHLMFRSLDIVLFCNAANAVFCFLPRLTGKRVVLNVDGLERKRQKWNALGRLHYRLSERLSCVAPNAVVTDAEIIRQYYRKRYNKDSFMIAYGAEGFHHPPGPTLARLGLDANEYFLYVSRLEPENNALMVIKAFEDVRSDRRLVVLGDAPYSREYIHRLKATTDARILFPGAIYGDGYRELVSNAFCYIHATEVGGTHPALIENMATGNLIAYLDTPENSEVAGSAGLPFHADDDSLRLILQDIADEPEQFASFKEAARQRAQALYDWEQVVTDYLQLFRQLVPADTSPGGSNDDPSADHGRKNANM